LARTRPTQAKPRPWIGRHRRSLLALAAVVVTVVLACSLWWTVDVMAFRPPVPDLQVADNQQIIEFMAHPKGLDRLSLPDREQFVLDLVQTCSDPERRRDFVRRIRQLSGGERTEIREALAHTVRDRINRDAAEYRQVTDAAAREEFVNRRMGRYARMQKSLKGKAPEENILLTLDEKLPDSTEGWTKYFLNRTTPTERAMAKPYLDHVEERMRQMKNSEYEREQFERQYVGSG
jgi:hypothetical protein